MYDKPEIVGKPIDDIRDEIKHYGTPRHSGRYPWGSGDNPYQRNKNFMAQYRELKDKGMNDAEIAEELQVLGRQGKPSSSKVKTLYTMALNQEKRELIVSTSRMHDKGMSNVAIAERLGISEGTVRNMLKENALEKIEKATETADILKKELKSKKYIDVGAGVNLELGISESKLKTALTQLEQEGYTVTNIKVPNATNPDVKTTMTILGPKGSTWGEIISNQQDIKSVGEYYSADGGKTYQPWKYPTSVDSKRLMIRYPEEGGADKDGVIEIRKGCADLSLGDSSYAQVRIAVDDKSYLKGMAIYSDGKDMPDGVDIIFNTSKPKGTDVMNKVLKPLHNKEFKEDGTKDAKYDPLNPFGAALNARSQSYYEDPKTGEMKLSPINKLKEEGEWDEYSKTIASQMLAKQPISLVNRQLQLTYADKRAEYDEIMALENNILKKKLLTEFGDKCDADAVKLKASPFPGQSAKVLLPLTCIKDTEIYAPTYPDGTKVALIRYPHGGTFEIPELIVNNKNKTARDIIGQSMDAVGITPATANKLSGADFDGDSVTVIPLSDKVNIKSSTLDAIKGFEPKDLYQGYEGMKKMTDTQMQMGMVSNLIMDMTIQGAPVEDIAKAVKHSMVVIDAEKHGLDYKQSEKDNEIQALKNKWQGGGGATTLITRAKNEVYKAERKEDWKPDENGKKVFRETGRMYYDKKKGGMVLAERKYAQMELTDDAYTLSTGTKVENAYADYANKMKALGNECRKSAMSLEMPKKNTEAAKEYEAEVSKLKADLNLALKNAPRERMAQIEANQEYLKAKKAYEEEGHAKPMSKDQKSKIKNQAIIKARLKYGSDKKSVRIQINDREWEAIQKGALNATTISQIFNNTDADQLRKLAMPGDYNINLTPAKQSQIKALINSGYTIAQVADKLGLSASTVSKYK